MTDLARRREALRTKHGYTPCPAPGDQKVGIAPACKTALRPLHGLRIAPTAGTTGWYLWVGGDMPREDDAFVPLHVAHLATWCPDALPYLELPPGWRFLVSPGHEDVWFDPQLDLSPS